MAKQQNARWEQALPIGYHLKMGASTLAHAWRANDRGWFCFMSEGDKRGNPPPVHGHYASVEDAKLAAEKGGQWHTVPMFKAG